jgi:hypothetical protein
MLSMPASMAHARGSLQVLAGSFLLDSCHVLCFAETMTINHYDSSLIVRSTYSLL